MSFFDFLLKFWWLEVVMLVGIFFAYLQDFISLGIALLTTVASFVIFLILSRSGLE